MKINGYVVKYGRYGITSAEPRVYIEKKTLFSRIKLKKVWVGSEHKNYEDAERMLPDDMLNWFSRAILEYENYEKQWEDFYKKSEDNTIVDLNNVPKENGVGVTQYSNLTSGVRPHRSKLLDTAVKLSIF